MLKQVPAVEICDPRSRPKQRRRQTFDMDPCNMAMLVFELSDANHFIAARRFPDDELHCRLADLSGGHPLHPAI
jgi:hypothetical protein